MSDAIKVNFPSTSMNHNKSYGYEIHKEFQQYYGGGNCNGTSHATDSGNNPSEFSDSGKTDGGVLTSAGTIATTKPRYKHNNKNNINFKINHLENHRMSNVERYLLEYDSSSSIKIRRICVPCDPRDEMQKLAKILEWHNQDRRALIVHINDSLVELTVNKLRHFGFWVFALTNQTKDVKELAQKHTVYCTPVTTINFLLENLELLKSTSVLITFENFWKRFNFLERYMRYKVANAKTSSRFTGELYQMTPRRHGNDKFE